jgi:hypothetical protein
MSREHAAAETEAATASPAHSPLPAVALQPASPQWTRHLQRSLGNRAFGALLQRQVQAPAGAVASPADLPAQRTYNVVIVGSPGKAEVDANHAYQFAEAAAKAGGTSADTVWLVERTGYELGHVDLGEVTRRAGSAHVFWITPQRPLAQLLSQFPASSVGSLHAYSHGLVGLLALRHGWSDTPDYGLSTEDARRLAPSVFTPGARISFDACNIGTGGDESLAQAIADAVQRPVEAWTGRTSYREFNRPAQYPNPEARGSRIFPEGGGTDLTEFYSTVLRGREPQEFLFGPRSSPGDWTGRYRINARLPKTRTFPVAQGQGVTVRMNAYSDFRDAQGMKLTVQLHRVRTLFDDDIGPSHEVRVGGADTEFSWTGLDAGTYYLELWHLSGMTVEGDVSVRLGKPAGGTLARSVREAPARVLARAPLASAPRRILARSVEDDVQQWTTGLPRAARDGGPRLTVTLHDAPADPKAPKTAPTLNGADAGGSLDQLTPAQAAVVSSIAAARKAYEAAGKLTLYTFEGKVGWYYPGRLDDPTPTQITAPAAGVDPARTKAQEAVWKELRDEGGTGSINAYDSQYVTWGRGLGAKSSPMATAMDIAMADAAVRAEFLKVGIAREGGRWLVVNTRTGAVEQGDDAVFLMQGSKDILSAIAGVSELPALRQTVADAQWASIAVKEKAGDVPAFAYGWDPRLIQFAAHMTHGGPAFGWTSTALKAPGWTKQKPVYEKDTARDLYERSGGDAGKVLLAWARARCEVPEPNGAFKITSQTVLVASWLRHMGSGVMADLLATKGSGPLDIPAATVSSDADLAGHMVLKMPEGGYYVFPALSPAKEQALGPNVHTEYLTRFDRMSMEAMLPELEKLGRALLPHYFSRDARIHAAPIANEQRLWWAKDVVLNKSVPKPPPPDGDFVPVHPDQVRAAYRYLKQPVPKQYQEGAALARRVLARAFVNSPEAIESYYRADGAAPDDAVLTKAKTMQAGIDKLMAQALALRTELDTAAKGGAAPDAAKLAELGRLRREIMAALTALLPLLDQLQAARPAAAPATPAKKGSPDEVAEKLFGPAAADPRAAAQANLTRLQRWEKRERIDALSRDIAAATDPAQRDALVAQRKVLVDELRSTIRDIKQFSGPWATWDYLDAGGKTSWDYDSGQVSKIKTSACGPTTLAIILDFLAQGDPEGLLQPGKDVHGTELVKWAIDYAVAAGAHAVGAPTEKEKAKSGDHGVASQGTSGTLMTKGLQAKLGSVKGEHIGADQERAKQELAKGNLVICLGPGHFVLMDDFREDKGFHIFEVGNVFGATGWTKDWAAAGTSKRAFAIKDMWVVSGGY